MKCQHHSGCNEIAARGRNYLCIKHRDERADEKVKEVNARGTAKKQAYRAANPILCLEPGCTNPVVGKSHRCLSCKAKREASITAIYIKHKTTSQREERLSLAPPKPNPRKKFKPIMTDAEQRRVDAAIAAREREQLMAKGYGHGPVKRLTAEEIAAIASRIPMRGTAHHDFGCRERHDMFQ